MVDDRGCDEGDGERDGAAASITVMLLRVYFTVACGTYNFRFLHFDIPHHDLFRLALKPFSELFVLQPNFIFFRHFGPHQLSSFTDVHPFS